MSKISQMRTKQNLLLSDASYFATKDNLSAEDQRKFDSLIKQIDKNSEDIAFENRRIEFLSERFSYENAGSGMSDAEIKTLQRFSVVKFIRESASGNLTGLEAEMATDGENELKNELGLSPKGFIIPRKVLSANQIRNSTGQNITTAGDGGNLAKTLPVMYFDALQAAMVLPSLGATFLSGLTGKLPIVGGGLFSSTWAEEGVAVDAAKASVTKTLMEAKRLTAVGAFSSELMNQSSISVENWVRQGLVNSNAQALLAAAIAGTGLGGQPKGVLYTDGIGDVAGGTDGAAPTWAHIVDLESKLSYQNADTGSLAYLTNAKVRGKLKQTLKSSGVPGYIWDESGIMNGYRAACSNIVPSNLDKGSGSGIGVCSAIIFGNWADLIIAEWGGLDIVTDIYTLKKKAEIEISVSTYADIAVAHAASFAAMKDALTA